MWADTYWLFSDSKEKIGVHGEGRYRRIAGSGDGAQAGIGVVDETQKDEGGGTLKVPFREVFDVLGYRFHRNGKGTQGIEKTLRKGMGSWWRDGHIYRSKSALKKDEVPEDGEPGSERQRQLALECCHAG